MIDGGVPNWSDRQRAQSCINCSMAGHQRLLPWKLVILGWTVSLPAEPAELSRLRNSSDHTQHGNMVVGRDEPVQMLDWVVSTFDPQNDETKKASNEPACAYSAFNYRFYFQQHTWRLYLHWIISYILTNDVMPAEFTILICQFCKVKLAFISKPF